MHEQPSGHWLGSLHPPPPLSSLCPCESTSILDSGLSSDVSSRFKISASNWLCSADGVVNLEFMKESLNEKSLIPCLVIKTSWHKLSTVLGHGGSSFYLQGSKKCSDSLSLSRKTHTPGGLTLTTCQSFLVQPALGPAAPMRAPLPYHPPSAAKNQYSVEKTLFPLHRWLRGIRRETGRSRKSKQFLV